MTTTRRKFTPEERLSILQEGEREGQTKLLPILRTTISLFLIDYNHSYDDVNLC